MLTYLKVKFEALPGGKDSYCKYQGIIVRSFATLVTTCQIT
jgi:hypothetical protein